MMTSSFKKLFCKPAPTLSLIKITATANSTYPKMAVRWLNQALYFYQSFCLVDSEVLRNRYLRVAAQRYSQF